MEHQGAERKKKRSFVARDPGFGGGGKFGVMRAETKRSYSGAGERGKLKPGGERGDWKRCDQYRGETVGTPIVVGHPKRGRRVTERWENKNQLEPTPRGAEREAMPKKKGPYQTLGSQSKTKKG